MRKLLLIWMNIFVGFTLLSQGPNLPKINVQISGTIFNGSFDSIKISQFYGKFYKDFISTKPDKKGNFSMKGTLPYADYYMLRLGNENLQLILRDSANIKVYGDGKKIREFCNIINSDESQQMNQFSYKLDRWSAKIDSATTALKLDTSRAQVINTYMSSEYSKYQSQRQEFMAMNQNSPQLILVLKTMNIETEFADYEGILNQVIASFGQSPTVMEYKKYFDSYKAQRDAGLTLGIGKVAPDFEQLGTDQKTNIKLSDLRGKVVLIDFWASWCGPCRKENPNVVKTFAKYKDDGFTVMSVSLDTDKEKWLAAIKQDNLTWPNHVSDLRGWNNRVAGLYDVKSVPFTVLIDQQGKIIKTNLRGEALESELQRIYGH